jgi:hypothetical protein
MTSFRQFEANRRNAVRSTEDYEAFEATIIADYCAETAVARELVLRLASLLWRLRRATAIETDLLEIQAEDLRERRLGVLPDRRLGPYDDVVRRFAGAVRADAFEQARDGSRPGFGERIVEEHQPDGFNHSTDDLSGTKRQLTYCFLRLVNLDSGVFERLNRYEGALWRQTVQTLIALHPVGRRF